jgi:hypothetical protein
VRLISPLILKRAPIGWNQGEGGEIVGRIFKAPIVGAD